MTSKLYQLVSQTMHVPISEITDDSGPKSIETWDSFNLYLLLNEIESEYNMRFTLDESLDIKSVADFKKHLKNHGIILND